MGYGTDGREGLRVPARELRHAIPQVYAGYRQLHDTALAAGALDVKTKELIALAIAVSKECDGCIAAHAHAAVQHGRVRVRGDASVALLADRDRHRDELLGPRVQRARGECRVM